MATITKILPLYYTTLSKEYGLTYNEISSLDAKNEVYVLEVHKADLLKQKGNNDTQILAYYKSQGYNSAQVAKISAYLSSATTVDTTGQTGRDKLNETLKTITSISNTALPILAQVGAIFGFNQSVKTSVNVPDLATYKPETSTGTIATQVDSTTGQIGNGNINTSSSLQLGLNAETGLIVIVIAFLIYMIFQTTKTVK